MPRMPTALARLFTWPGISKDTKAWCRSCPGCQQPWLDCLHGSVFLKTPRPGVDHAQNANNPGQIVYMARCSISDPDLGFVAIAANPMLIQ